MAVSAVQKYLNMAVSLTASNKSNTDVSYSLPNDLRRYENVKIKKISTERTEVAGGATEYSVDRIDGDDSLCFVFASHPINITEVNGQALTNTLKTTFFGIARDRAGAYGATASVFKYKNNLHTPNYTSDSGGATSTVELLIVQIVLEA